MLNYYFFQQHTFRIYQLMLCDSLFLADEGIFDDLAATKLLITGFYLL
jgi:hypothetical protein